MGHGSCSFRREKAPQSHNLQIFLTVHPIGKIFLIMNLQYTYFPVFMKLSTYDTHIILHYYIVYIVKHTKIEILKKKKKDEIK